MKKKILILSAVIIGVYLAYTFYNKTQKTPVNDDGFIPVSPEDTARKAERFASYQSQMDQQLADKKSRFNKFYS